jgi:hypothetical protein
MRKLIHGLTIAALAWPAAPALAQSSVSEAQFVDIEASCSAEIAAYDREYSPAKGQDAASSVRIMLAQFPVNRDMYASLRTTLQSAGPKQLGPTYICAASRRIAQMDGAPLIARRAAPSRATRKAAGGVLATGSGERYWLKGLMVMDDASPSCGDFAHPCPDGKSVRVFVDAAYPTFPHQTGGIFPGEFGLGLPLPVGAGWRVRIQQPANGFYECEPANSNDEGTVEAADPRATNANGAMVVITLECRMTPSGITEFHRLAADKAASDERLQRQH